MEINVFSNYTLLLGSLSFALLPTTFILDLEKKKRYVYFPGFHYKTYFSLS